MNTRLMRTAILLALALVAIPGPVDADIYIYRDAKGVMHFTDIPTKPVYRPFQRLGSDQQPPQQKPQLTLRKAVAACVASVREEGGHFSHMDAQGRPHFTSDFDAYVSSSEDSTVNFIGSERERFRFKKCMDEKGHPLD